MQLPGSQGGQDLDQMVLGHLAWSHTIHVCGYGLEVLQQLITVSVTQHRFRQGGLQLLVPGGGGGGGSNSWPPVTDLYGNLLLCSGTNKNIHTIYKLHLAVHNYYSQIV